jgi:hypothetical protein
MAAISLAALMISSIFLYEFHALPAAAFTLGNVVNSSPGTADLSAQGGAYAAASASTTVVTLPEMHIANNGLVLLRGAQVTSVSGDTIQVEMIWNSVQFT